MTIRLGNGPACPWVRLARLASFVALTGGVCRTSRGKNPKRQWLRLARAASRWVRSGSCPACHWLRLARAGLVRGTDQPATGSVRRDWLRSAPGFIRHPEDASSFPRGASEREKWLRLARVGFVRGVAHLANGFVRRGWLRSARRTDLRSVAPSSWPFRIVKE